MAFKTRSPFFLRRCPVSRRHLGACKAAAFHKLFEPSSHLAIARTKTSDLRVEGQSLSTTTPTNRNNYRARADESKIIQHTAIHQSSQSQPLAIMSENTTPLSTPPPTPSTPPPPAPPSTFSVELMTTEVAIPPALARIEPVRIIYAFSFEAPQARDRRDERHTQKA